jgi:Centrosome microtubule-binding domain of Cep57
LTQEYDTLDPGRGKKRRKAIADNLRSVLEEFEAKADQIYALYDVAEGAKSAGAGSSATRKGWFEL